MILRREITVYVEQCDSCIELSIRDDRHICCDACIHEDKYETYNWKVTA
jgi:hypothetical protein